MGEAPSAAFTIVPAPGFDEGLVGLAGAFLLLRAFSSGAAALTGVEAISNGVPNFRKPKSKNAATTLLLLGVIGASMLAGIMYLAQATKVHIVLDPATEFLLNGLPLPDDYIQNPAISQIAQTIFGPGSIPFYIVVAATGVILVFASNTAFNGFPVLGSILAQDGYLPRQFRTRGDRLAFSNGVLALAAGALVLIIAFNADVTKLIQLYIVGVFISFTASQLGMIRHWGRELKLAKDKAVRRRMVKSRTINSIGFGMTALVLVIVLITKFEQGAWIALLAMFILFLIMWSIRAHYDNVAKELAVDEDSSPRALPTRVHAVLLVSHVRKPVLRALAYARASRPVAPGCHYGGHRTPPKPRTPSTDWEKLEIPVPLTVLASPYRETVTPDHGLRQADAPRLTARPDGGLHPRIRGGQVVGATGAQPDGAAHQDQAALRTRSHGGQRAVAAQIIRRSKEPPGRAMTAKNFHPSRPPQIRSRTPGRNSSSRSAPSRTADIASHGTKAASSSSGTASPGKKSGSG